METCRLCDGAVSAVFRKTLAAKYDVGYYLCSQCGSLQTERPYWLEEIYADPRPITDVGIVQRCSLLAMQVHALLDTFGVPQEAVCIDWGGGNGLFTRMMRDRGYNFYCHEPYTDNFYVPFHGSNTLDDLHGAVVTAFEVFEHLPDPGRDLKEVFAVDPDLLIATTEPYCGQGDDWWYLAEETGQHVFFYSQAGLSTIAQQHGRALISGGGLHVFYREQPKKLVYTHSAIDSVQRLLENPASLFRQMVTISLQHLSTPYKYVQKDYDSIVTLLKHGGILEPYQSKKGR